MRVDREEAHRGKTDADRAHTDQKLGCPGSRDRALRGALSCSSRGQAPQHPRIPHWGPASFREAGVKLCPVAEPPAQSPSQHRTSSSKDCVMESGTLVHTENPGHWGSLVSKGPRPRKLPAESLEAGGMLVPILRYIVG